VRILRHRVGPYNNALKLTKRAGPFEGALRAPSSLSRASQLSAVLGELFEKRAASNGRG
jgi:hypothetical protein